MELWLTILFILGLLLKVVIGAALMIFLEAAFRQWPDDEEDNFNDFDDDLDAAMRRKNYGD